MKVIEAVEEIYEMARICKLPSDNNIEIFVNTDDGGNMPHFHVWKKLSRRVHEWETCIKFEEPEYFLHGKYKDKVSTKIAKEIDKVLRSKKINDRSGRTYWQAAVDSWNDNNSNVTLPMDLQQPDYTTLNV